MYREAPPQVEIIGARDNRENIAVNQARFPKGANRDGSAQRATVAYLERVRATGRDGARHAVSLDDLRARWVKPGDTNMAVRSGYPHRARSDAYIPACPRAPPRVSRGLRWPGHLVNGGVVSHSTSSGGSSFVVGPWGVRYQVSDVARAVAFYTRHLGFTLDHQNLPAFGQVSLGGLKLILSGPGASGSRPLPDGRTQGSGGWNRIVLRVDDLAAHLGGLRDAGVRFRNEMETGPGGSQVQIEDPDGNPVELFEPARRA